MHIPRPVPSGRIAEHVALGGTFGAPTPRNTLGRNRTKFAGSSNHRYHPKALTVSSSSPHRDDLLELLAFNRSMDAISLLNNRVSRRQVATVGIGGIMMMEGHKPAVWL